MCLRLVISFPESFKCLERLILNHVQNKTKSHQDPCQFAYKSKRGVEDAVLTFLDLVYSHIDLPRNYCRILFVDFSSAFNTIQPHILIDKQRNMLLEPILSLWILDFLTNRTQYVKFNETLSQTITTNTGAPQGCVLSPVLFTLYTDECRIDDDNVKLIKFADDSVIVGLCNNDTSENDYREQIVYFDTWCDQHHLALNVKKTKEMVIDFRRIKNALSPLSIKNENVDTIDCYTYLGINIDDKLNWSKHTTVTSNKLSQRIGLLRKLSYLNIDNTLLSLFYKSTVESVLSWCLAAWGGNIRKGDSTRLNRAVTTGQKLCNDVFPSLSSLYENQCLRKINKILLDENHPLSSKIKFSARTGRVLHLRCNRDRYFKSFLPSSVRMLN